MGEKTIPNDPEGNDHGQWKPFKISHFQV